VLTLWGESQAEPYTDLLKNRDKIEADLRSPKVWDPHKAPTA